MWRSTETRGIGLIIFTGLIVSWVRQGLQHHWHSFASWEQFFISWFIHALGVGILSGFAAAAIIGSHKFFVGTERKDDFENLFFVRL